jgi:hypothetical protein
MSKCTPSTIIIIFKAVDFKREKHQLTYKGKHVRITSDLSAHSLKARKAWNSIFQALKESSYQVRILYPAVTFNFDREKPSRIRINESSSRPPSLHCRRYLRK